MRDHNPSGIVPYVTYGLLAANILIFISYLQLFGDERALSYFFHSWGVVPANILAGQGYETLISSMFLHGGIMHLAGNMLFLWIFGDNLEEALGRLPYFLFYILSGVAAALMQVAAAPGSGVPMVGASGAIAGVMGGYLLLYPRARIDVLVILIFLVRIVPVPAWAMLGFWFVLQLFSGTASAASGGGVAYWAHAGGFVAGAVFCLPLWLKRGGARGWRPGAGQPPHPEARYRIVRTSVPRVARRKKRGPWSR